MKIHHLTCGCMCPIGGGLMDGVTRGLGPARLVCHCLLLETDEGLVLCDTGFGLRDMRPDHNRVAPFFRLLNRPSHDESATAVRQIEALGYRVADVRHIVLTHLDFDHAGGLSDFPHATVHLMAQEAFHARHAHGFIDSRRYRRAQWADEGRWLEYTAQGESWFGFSAVRALHGLPPEVLLVPLFGHTRGHAGIAVQTSAGWLLHAGDAYFHHAEMQAPPEVPCGRTSVSIHNGGGPGGATVQPSPVTFPGTSADWKSTHFLRARSNGVRTHARCMTHPLDSTCVPRSSSLHLSDTLGLREARTRRVGGRQGMQSTSRFR